MNNTHPPQNNGQQEDSVPFEDTTVKNTLSYSWKLTKNHFVLFFCALIIPSLIYGVANGLTSLVQDDKDIAMNIALLIPGALLMIAAIVVSLAVSQGFIRAVKNPHDIRLKQFFSLNGNVGKAILTSLCTMIVAATPLIFGLVLVIGYFTEGHQGSIPPGAFIVLGITFLVTLATIILIQYAVYYTLDDGVSPTRAIGYSIVDVYWNLDYVVATFFISIAVPLVALGIVAALIASGVVVLAIIGVIILAPLMVLYSVWMNVLATRVYCGISHERRQKAIQEASEGMYPEDDAHDGINSDFQEIMESRGYDTK